MDFEQAMHADAQGLTLAVNPENVIQMHHIIRAEAQLLIRGARLAAEEATIEPPGQDSISRNYTPKFNDKIAKVVVPGAVYGQRLMRVAEEIADQARRYGHAEGEITGSFTQFYRDYRARYLSQPHGG